MKSQTQFGLLLISTILVLGVTILPSPAYSQGTAVLDSLIVPGVPIADDFTVTIVQGEEHTIVFPDFTSDIKDDDVDLRIIINRTGTDATGTEVTSPGAGTLEELITFNPADIAPYTLARINGFALTNNPTNELRVSPLFYADVGDYTLPYRVQDRDDNRDHGIITITVTARTNAVPTVTPITTQTTGTADVNINFHGAISDDIGNDDDLTVTFSFDTPTHTDFFIPDGLTAVSDVYTLSANPVTFTYVSTPIVTTDIGLTYTVTDRNGGTSADGSVTITFNVDTSSNISPTATVFTVTNQNNIDFHTNVNDDDETDDASLIITFSFQDPTDAAIFTIDTDDATFDAAGLYTLVNNPVKFTSTSPTFDVTLDYAVSDRIVEVTSTVQLVRTALTIPTPADINYVHDADTPTFTNTYDMNAFTLLIGNPGNSIPSGDFDNVNISFVNTNTAHESVNENSGSAISFVYDSSTDPSTGTLSFTPHIDESTIFPLTITEEFTVSYNGREGTATFTFNPAARSCSSEITNTENIDFGRLADVQVSAEQSFSVLNNGNIPHDLSLSATAWLDTADDTTEVMLVGVTAYATTADVDYATKTNLTDVANPTLAITDHPVADSRDIYLQLSVDLINEDFTGGTQQTISTTLSCTMT